MIGVHVVLVGAAVLLVLAGRPALAGWVAGMGWRHRPWAELRRLWRKEGVAAGMAVAGPCAGIVLACAAGAALLVPTVAAAAPEPFGDLLVVFGLLAAGRVVGALGAVEAGGVAGGGGASRTMQLLAAAGPAVLVVALIVAGMTGTTNLGGAVASLRDSAGPAVRVSMLLAGCAVALLGWTDLWAGDAGLPGFVAGRAVALLRVAEALRCVAWVDLVAALVPPVVPGMAWTGVGVWAVKLVVVAGVLAVAEGRVERPGRAVAAPVLAGLLGLVGALLALTGGPA